MGEGEPPSKPDVTVSVNKENFLKVLNKLRVLNLSSGVGLYYIYKYSYIVDREKI